MKTGYIYKHDEAPLLLHVYLMNVPPPPASVNNSNAIAGPFQMFGNDTVGDCTGADICNGVMLNTSLGAGMVVPTTAQAIAFYSGYSGYNGDPSTDTGASLSQAADYAKSVGLIGHKLHAYLDVDDSNLVVVKQAIWLFKGCSIGVNLPKSAEDDFGKKTWDNITDTNIVGGHDVYLVDYDEEGPWCLTWAGLQKMTWAWFSHYTVETQARLYEDAAGWVTAYGFNMSQLETDLVAL